MWSYYLENYGYVALAFAQRQVLLSSLGFAVMLVVGFCWRRHSAQSMLFAWQCFGGLVLPLSLLEPADILNNSQFNALLHGIHERLQLWLPLQVLSPCELPFSERLSAGLTFFPALSWHKFVLGLWLLLAGVKVFSVLNRRRILSRIAHRAQLITSSDVCAAMTHWQQRYSVRRSISLRTSEAASQVFTIGVFKPIIFLPRNLLQQLGDDDVDAVLGHEMAHIKRLDDLFLCIQLALKTLLFFNPLVWFCSRRITALRERCCDALAIQVGALPPHNYAKSLLRAAEIQTDQRFDNDVAVGLISSALAGRIHYVLGRSEIRPSYLPALIIAFALFLSSMILMPDFTSEHVIDGNAARQLLARLKAIRPLPLRAAFGEFSVAFNTTCFAREIDYYHPGVDFVAATSGNQNVRAIADGRIDSITNTAGYAGSIVQIQHADGVVSTYIHLGSVSVREGEHIQAGQAIGAISGDHLHLEVRKGSALVNPSSL